jgi:hypothetical protein
LEAGRLDRACLDQPPLLLLQRLAELKVERGRPGKPALGEAQASKRAGRANSSSETA